MRRRLVVVLCIAVSLMFIAQARRRSAAPPVESEPQNPGLALTGLTASQLAAFNIGRGGFQVDETPQSGLGPVFNEASCRDCHNVPSQGGGSGRGVTKFGTWTNGTFDAMTQLGGSVLQDRALRPGPGLQHAFTPESVPATATVSSHRRTTPLYGLGLVDATPDATFIALAATEEARGDGTAGHVNIVDNIRAGTQTVGRFGWKAQVPTLFQFAGDALLNEMGITSPDFPNENCPQGNCAELAFNPAPGLNDTGTRVSTLTDYMRMLAAPSRAPQNAQTIAGEQVFNTIGCASCHASTLTTGSSTIAALDHKTYHPYSDFLLHDMGTLGDGLGGGIAKGNEMRTAPLWGLRLQNRYLHDQRATTLDQAIAMHDGQGRAARDAFAGLSADDRAKLMAFLQSL